MKDYNPRKVRKELGLDKDVMLAPQAPNPNILEDGIMDVLTHAGVFTPEDCAKVLVDNPDPTWLESNEANIWLFDKMLALVMSANTKFQFEVEFFEALRLLGHEEGMSEDWGMDLGRGMAGNRKLTVVVQLSSHEDYEGGDLVLDTNTENFFSASRELGSVIVFPSFVRHQVTPVTKGTRYSLVAWASGTDRFR